MSRLSGIRIQGGVPPRGLARPSNVGVTRRQVPRHRIAVDPVELNRTSTIPIFADDGTAIACPECKTTKAGRPSLELLYSKCCGRVVCDSCARKYDRPVDCPTPGCGARLDRLSWDPEPPDVGRFRAETNQRKIYAEHLNLHRDDFDSQDRFDDYCEEIQDFIYDSTFGNDAMKHEAEARHKQIEAKYHQEIQRSKKRKRIEQRDLHNMTATLQYLEEKALLNERERERRDHEVQKRKKHELLCRKYEEISRRAQTITILPDTAPPPRYQIDEYGNIDPERIKLMQASGFIDMTSPMTPQCGNHAFFMTPL